MKRKDVYRLAKISLASRKQTSKSTVRGIAFGMILLVPVLFIIVGLYGDLNSKVNSNPLGLYANVNYVNQDTPVEKYYGDVVSSERAANIADKTKVDFKLDYEALHVPFDMDVITTNEDEMDSNGIVMAVLLEGEADAVNLGFGDSDKDWSDVVQTSFTAVIDRADLDDFVPAKTARHQSDVFLSGYDGGFQEAGKGEVIVSERLLEVLGYSPADVYGKKLSVAFLDMSYRTNYNIRHLNDKNYNLKLDTDSQPHNDDFESLARSQFGGDYSAYHFCDYLVVGIIKEEITAGTEPNNLMSNMFYLSDASFDVGGGRVLRPELNIIKGEGDYSGAVALATYTTEQEEFEELNSEFAASGAFMFSSVMAKSMWDRETETSSISAYNQRTLFLDTGSYQQLDKAVDVITAELVAQFPDGGKGAIAGVFASPVFSNMYMMYSVSNYLVLFLSIMGGIIFFAAMVNLFNSIVHSVDSRRHYLAVTRAIGGKDSLIPKLYIAESLTLFRRAFLWVIIFGGGICTGIKIGLDYLFAFINESGIMGSTKFGISFWYIPLSLAIGLGLLLLLGFAFSVGISRKVSKDPIMSILGDS